MVSGMPPGVPRDVALIDKTMDSPGRGREKRRQGSEGTAF